MELISSNDKFNVEPPVDSSRIGQFIGSLLIKLGNYVAGDIVQKSDRAYIHLVEELPDDIPANNDDDIPANNDSISQKTQPDPDNPAPDDCA